jgi:hypothetical protein
VCGVDRCCSARLYRLCTAGRRIDLGLGLSGDVSLCINLFQHYIDRGQALAMPADLRGELRWKWAAVTGYRKP